MVWIIAFLCLGVAGAAGYKQGPIRGAFTFFGLLFGTFLAGPLSPLTKRLLPLVGLHHPAWNIFAPQILAFLIVLIIFKIAGQVAHQKVAVFYKYKVDDQTMYAWQRVYSRLGLSVGLLNGAFYFILLTLLIYSAGYFTTEAASGSGDPASARFLTETRDGLHGQNLDRVLASYDMVPPQVYQAADLGALLLHNPQLLSRLRRYPPCLQLAEQQQFKDLIHDDQLQQMITSQAKVSDILNFPRVHDILTNGPVVTQLRSLIGQDLDDLNSFLATGQSAKYDSETILGIWDIDRAATMAQARKRQPNITLTQLAQKEQDLFPQVEGLSVIATPDNQVILERPRPGGGAPTVVAAGTWKKDGETYEVNLPGSLPETSEIEFEQGTRLYLPKFGYALAFDKEF
jgi:hypothetical protein